MGKILFIDIDGTLVDYENRLPASAVQAIRAARAAGHRVYLCSGRSKAENKQEIWDIGLDGYIGGNGSYVESDGVVVMHQLITPAQCRRIVDWLHSRKLEFYLESNSGLYGSEHFRQRALPVMQEYCRRKGKPDAEQVDTDSVFPAMIYGADLYRDDVNKVSYILESYQDFLDAREAFPDLQNGTLGRSRGDGPLRRPGGERHHQSPRGGCSAGVSGSRPERHHCLWRCGGGYPHVPVLCPELLYGQRRRRRQGRSRLCDHRGG